MPNRLPARSLRGRRALDPGGDPEPSPTRSRPSRTLPPEAAVILASVSVQLGASVATGLLRDHGAVAIVALRLVFGSLLLLIIRPPRRLPALRARAWRSAAWLGLVFVVMNVAFYVAISRIPLGVAVTIEFWGPLAVAILGSRRARDLLWAALAAAGIYTLAGGRLSADDVLGVVAAVVAGGGWLLYILSGPRVARDWPGERGLMPSLAFGSAIVVPLALATGDLGRAVIDPAVLAGGFIIAAFSSAIPWSLELFALARMRAATYGVLMSLEPAIAALVGFLLLGQALDPAEVVAIGMVAVASAGASLSARRLRVVPGELESA